MSDPFNDDELDRQLATRLASRGWTVTPPKGAKPPPAPPPDIQIGLLAAQTEIPFSDIQLVGGWDDIEASVTKSVKHAHMAELSRMHILDRALSWRGWHKDNTLEQMIGLTVLPYIENYDPKKHRPWGSLCVMSVPVPGANATNTASYLASRSQARFNQLKDEQALMNIRNAMSAEQAQRMQDPSLSMRAAGYREKHGDQFRQGHLGTYDHNHDLQQLPKPTPLDPPPWVNTTDLKLKP